MKMNKMDLEININMNRVINLMKHIVNTMCEDGFEWFPEVEPGTVSAIEIISAISLLENQIGDHAERTIHIVDDLEDEDE